MQLTMLQYEGFPNIYGRPGVKEDDKVYWMADNDEVSDRWKSVATEVEEAMCCGVLGANWLEVAVVYLDKSWLGDAAVLDQKRGYDRWLWRWRARIIKAEGHVGICRSGADKIPSPEDTWSKSATKNNLCFVEICALVCVYIF